MSLFGQEVSYVPHGFAVFFFLTTVTFILLWLFVDSPIGKKFTKDDSGEYGVAPGGYGDQQPPTDGQPAGDKPENGGEQTGGGCCGNSGYGSSYWKYYSDY